MTVQEMRDILSITSITDLKDEYRLLKSIKSRSTRDNLIISLVEQELEDRRLEA